MIKPYETFKESKERAIGFIPSSWNITSIKNVLEIPITDGPHTTPKFYDHGIPFLSAESIKGGKLDFNKKRGFISQEDFEIYSQKYAPIKGDIFMVKSGATTGNTAMVETDDVFNIWSPLAVFRAHKKKVYPKFLHFYLMSFNFKTLVEISWSYGTQQNIGMGVLSNLPISYGTMEEQTQIANYLDHKTSLIDSIIAQKEQLIEKLKEQRQAIINEAVTKGLNPNIPLKDSGIELLNEIPEHWEVTKLIGLCYLVRGNSSFKKDELLSSGKYVALQYGKTYKVNEVDEKYKFYVNDEFYKDSQIVNYGDTIIISTSETIEDLGHSVFYKRNDLGLLGGEQMMLKTKNSKINPKYLFYSSKVFLKDLRKNATGIKVYRFNINDLKNVFTPVPPILEQNSIVKHIETKSITIDKVILHTQTSIQKLKEYRQSIISEAVTGKIDVRDWQVPNNN